MIKICGITDTEIWDHCVASGVDYLGLMFYPQSPRVIDMAQAKALNQRARGKARTVAVLVDPDDALLETVIRHVAPDFLQLHGHEAPERLHKIQQDWRIPIIKALPIAEAEDFTAIDDYAALVEMFLFDAKPRPEDTLPGGNAHSFNWSLLKERVIPKPWFLAGGLTPENIREAARISGAEYFDLSSGVEVTKGMKSQEKISALMQEVATLPATPCP